MNKKLNISPLLKSIGIFMAMATFSFHAAAQDARPDISVHARIDTSNVTMGDKTVLHVEVLKNSHTGAMLDLPVAKEGQMLTIGDTEVRDLTIDSTQVGNGRIQLNYKFILQPFDPGVVTFAPFRYASQGDTAYSESVTIKVNEPEIPKEMRDSLYINPMMGTVSIPARWYDVIPEWWPWALIALGLIAIAVALIYLYKKNGPTLLPRKKVIPPYILAMSQLDELKKRKLAESGQDKEYYTELTAIMRQYMEGRFGIYAREMTSSEILDAMEADGATKPFIDSIRPVLETADFVKFAKMHALPEENVRSYNAIRNFVTATKPEEETTADGKNKKASKSAPAPVPTPTRAKSRRNNNNPTRKKS